MLNMIFIKNNTFNYTKSSNIRIFDHYLPTVKKNAISKSRACTVIILYYFILIFLKFALACPTPYKVIKMYFINTLKIHESLSSSQKGYKCKAKYPQYQECSLHYRQLDLGHISINTLSFTTWSFLPSA